MYHYKFFFQTTIKYIYIFNILNNSFLLLMEVLANLCFCFSKPRGKKNAYIKTSRKKYLYWNIKGTGPVYWETSLFVLCALLLSDVVYTESLKKHRLEKQPLRDASLPWRVQGTGKPLVISVATAVLRFTVLRYGFDRVTSLCIF